MKKATLEIIVEYPDGEDVSIEAALRGVALHAASRGLIDNHGQLTVESWDCNFKIENIEPATSETSTDPGRRIQKELEDDWS